MNHHRRITSIANFIAAALTIAACNKGNASSNTDQESAGSKTKQVSSNPTTQSADAEKRAVLASYERIRALLAKDAIEATTKDAASLEKAAHTVAKKEAARAQMWTSLAEAAKALNGMSKQDADEVRKSFGEVSRHLLSVLSGDTQAAKGLHVFECPMAQGYKKWVQPAPKISNPYMGTRMPECGSESSL